MGKTELLLTMMRKTSGKASLEERSKLLILRYQLDRELQIARQKLTEGVWNLEGGLGWRYKFASL